MRAVVVGGSGFLGSHIIDRLKKEEIEVLCIDKQRSAYIETLGVQFAAADITDKKTISCHLREGDIVIHVAAILGAAMAKWDVYKRFNVDGAKNVFDAAIEKKAKTFVFMSTFGVYGPNGSLEKPLTEESEIMPYSDYDRSKSLAEEYILKNTKNRICSIIIRSPVIFGPRANPRSGMGMLFTSIKRGLFVTFGTTRNTFAFCYVKNLANAIVHLISRHHKGAHILNIASTPPCTMENFLAEARKRKKFIVLKLPAILGIILADISLAVSRITSCPPALPKDVVLGLISDSYNNSIQKAIKDGYEEEYTMEQAIKETLEDA